MKQTFSHQIASLALVLGVFTGIGGAQTVGVNTIAGTNSVAISQLVSGLVPSLNVPVPDPHSPANPMSPKLNVPVPDPHSPANPMSPK